MTAGEYLRHVREMRGHIQKDYAKRLGLSAQYVNDIERDRRPIPAIRIPEFARVYGVTIERLFPLVVPIPAGFQIVRQDAELAGIP